MVKAQKTILFTVTILGMLMLGVLAVSLAPTQQAIAQVDSTNPNPQGQGQSSFPPRYTSQGEQQGSEIQ